MSTAEKLTPLVQQLADEEAKFDKGNSSAGTRARKLMQEIKIACTEGRNLIQDAKNATKG